MHHSVIKQQLIPTERLSLWQFMTLGISWLLVSSLLTFTRLTHPAFGIQGDLPLHYHITRSFAQSFAEGDFLPRWAGLLDGGRGDALFTFYPPLSYLLSAVLMKFFNIDVLTSLKLISLLILIIAQISAYLLAREFFSGARSVIVSLAYVLLPAYPLIALYRAFLANALALSLAPLVLLGAHLLLAGKRPSRGLVIFALSFSAVILTHTITTYLCGIVIGIMALIYLTRFDHQEARWRGVWRLGAAGIIVVALTAFFLWPQVVERNWGQVGLSIVQQEYRNYFLFAETSDRSRYRQAWSGLNYVTSLITLTQTLTAMLFGLICWRLLKPEKKTLPDVPIIRLSMALVAFGLFISLPISDPLWRYLPGMKYVQFPWRFQPFAALACGLLAAAALDRWKALGRVIRNLIAAGLTWLVIANCVFTVMLLRLDEPGLTRAQTAELLSSPFAKPVTAEEGRRLQDEDDLKFIPYAANEIYFRPQGSDFTLYPPAAIPGDLSFINGRGSVIAKQLNIALREFRIECEDGAQVRIETYYYPHWVARLNGTEVKIKVEEGTGLMLLDLPGGRHHLKLNYEIRDTSERVARSISIVAWLLFAGWGIFKLIAHIRAKSKLNNIGTRG
ncbi:MAG: hypothetical protein L0226_06700 [Acidobacteria bacterium]|nr:hypothetical protein [Acidobacteriota bacterium]